MGDECFFLECSKACDQHKWKNPHSCCLLECTAAFPEEPASPKTFSCLFFFCLALSWVTTFRLWILFSFRLHLCCHTRRCGIHSVGAGVWSEEVVPCWHLLRNKRAAFPLCVRSLTGTGKSTFSSLLKAAHVKCPPLRWACKLCSAV